MTIPMQVTFEEPNTTLRDPFLVEKLTVGGAASKEALDEFVSDLGLPPYLEPVPSYLKSWPGRSMLLCKIAEQGWRTAPLTGKAPGPLVFPDPSRHFDIHFEIQVLVKQAKMTVYLHYETNPYYSQAKLASADPSGLAKFRQRRSEFVEALRQNCRVPGFTVCSDIVQVGRAECRFAGMTASEGRAWLAPVLTDVAEAVDATIEEVDRRWAPLA